MKPFADLILMEMRQSMEMEKQRGLMDTRKQAETEKQRAIVDTKKKQWCAACGKEAIFYCTSSSFPACGKYQLACPLLTLQPNPECSDQAGKTSDASPWTDFLCCIKCYLMMVS